MMNILFLSLLDFENIEEHGIYTDLLREFVKNGHNVYAVSPMERRRNKKTYQIENEHVKILKLKIGNITKCNIIEKGISTLSIEPLFIKEIKKYFSDVKFDMVLYSTPPITFQRVVEFAKNRDGAFAYLMLKDIFPQNAVDIGMLSKTGIKGVLYKYFRRKEKKLYASSDYVGCMSQANIDYVLKHNPEIDASKVGLCPNSIEVQNMELSPEEKYEMRSKYNIPLNKRVFIYGGNLGKPQGIDFMIECLRSQKDNADVYFLIVGSGTEYGKVESFVNSEKQENVKLMQQMPRDDYDRMVASCDVGMVFLNHRFTIPNFPSRLLSYMQAGLPVLAVTDINTDIGTVICNAGFGWWCESNDFDKVAQIVRTISRMELEQMGKQGYRYLIDNYSSYQSYQAIVKHF